MIKNKAQLTKASKDAEALVDVIAKLQTSEELEDKIQSEIWTHRLSELTDEIEEFKSWENGTFLKFSLNNLPKAVVAMRAASGMTQKELAKRLDIKEQQIQRYENQEYLTASFERVVQLLRVLCRNLDVVAVPNKAAVSRFSEYMSDPAVMHAVEITKRRGSIMPIRKSFNEKCAV